MSFYGNRLYQLTNAFGKIFIKNSGKTISDFLTPTDPGSEEDVAMAVGLEAAYTFDTGNKWITLGKNNERGICFITHSPIDENDKSNNIATLALGNENDGAIELQAGDYIEIPHITYDNAGHITGSNETSYFRLPLDPTSIDLNDLKERMTAIEDSNKAQNQQLDDLNKKTIEVVKFAGELNDLTEMETHKDLTITQAIGNIDFILNETTQENTMPTIAGFIKKLYEEIEKLYEENENLNAQTKALLAMQGTLYDRVTKLESYHPD